LQIEECPQIVKSKIVDYKPVKLMAVNRQVAETRELPRIFLINPDPHQVRHYVDEPLIVVAFNPYHFYIPFGIRELPNVAEKFPVFLGKPAEIEIGEDVAQQDQPAEAVLLEHASGLAGAAAIRSQVHIGQDQRVIDGRIHALFLVQYCYGVMKAG
jgi:hypothetical protein